jgi:sulfur-oxidizing protein SoxY
MWWRLLQRCGNNGRTEYPEMIVNSALGDQDKRGDRTTRRDALKIAGAFVTCGAIASVVVHHAAATPADMQAAIGQVIGDAKVNAGKVKLDIPPLVENGNVVPCSITVDSPMTSSDHVRAIHVFNEKNPQPNVISIKLGPRAGRASISTRIRLQDTQTIVAIAELSDGTFWSDRVDVVITLGACLENPI